MAVCAMPLVSQVMGLCACNCQGASAGASEGDAAGPTAQAAEIPPGTCGGCFSRQPAAGVSSA